MMISELELRAGLDNPEKMEHYIIFLGMSQSGKTYWSKRLASGYGLNHIEFDHLIGESRELAELIKDIEGKDNAEKLGNYFGKPWDEGCPIKERQYLDIEKRLMSEVYPPGTILDLTGSAIYHSGQMRELVNTGLVINLEVSEEVQQELFQVYISVPKALCWGGIFNKKEGETNDESVARCYPLLLKYRVKLYREYADVTIPYEVHKSLGTPEKFVGEVCKRLKSTSSQP